MDYNCQQQIQLMELPDPIGIHIVSYMPVSSYLAFRRVSRKAKTWADDLGITSSSIKNQPIDWSEKRSVIMLMDRESDLAPFAPTMQEYLDSRLLISNFFLSEKEDDTELTFFQSPLMFKFLKKFAHRIVQLKMTSFNACKTPAELEFYEKMPNLKQLDVIALNYDKQQTKKIIPSTFRNLVHLHIHNYNTELTGYPTEKDFEYLFKLFSHCQNLSKLTMPWITNCMQWLFDKYGYDSEFMDDLQTVILDREKKLADGEFPCTRIKELGISTLWDYGSGNQGIDFVDLLEFCDQRDICVRDVDSSLFELITPPSNGGQLSPDYDSFDRRILSINNIIPATRILRLTALQEVRIKSTANSSIRENDLYENEEDWDDDEEYEDDDEDVGGDWNCRPTWPNLKRLEICFDSRVKSVYDKLNLVALCQFLFEDHPRSSVETLIVKFKQDFDILDAGMNFTKSKYFCPDPIVQNFTGLKVLELTNWEGLNKSFVKLWEGLHLLEKLTIDGCSTLGNVGFIGEDEQCPVFLKLKKLRQFTLIYLENMPKITDRFFRDVLQHMEIHEFRIISFEPRPLEKISVEGIGVLAEKGNTFSSTIKKIIIPEEHPFWKKIAQQFYHLL